MADDTTNTVTTLKEFLTYVRATLVKQAKDYQGDLGDYFRSLLGVIERHSQEPATYSLLAQVLTEAFTAAPLPFDPAWLVYTDPPDDENVVDAEQFSRLQQMLRYLIADWRRMDEAGTLKNEHRYYGVDSPTGNRWYNFDLAGFLECGTAGLGFDRAEDMSADEYITLAGGVEFKGAELLEHEKAQGEPIAPNWELITGLLWMGQNYE